MIQPPSGRSGTSAAPITIAAINEGNVVIDGQFANDGGVPRIPLRFCNNSWWVIQGINFKNSPSFVALLGNCSSAFDGPGSNDNIIRRSIFWDADGTQNLAVVQHAPGNRNLWEDVAAFGMGRNTWQSYTGQDNVCRRCWIRFEGNMSNTGPTHAFAANYGGATPESRTICENCLLTWWAGSMPESYTDGSDASAHNNYALAGQPTGPMAGEGNCGEPQGYKILGSLSYVRDGDSVSSRSNPTTMARERLSNDVTFKDFMVIITPGFSGARSVVGIALGDAACGTSPNTTGNVAENLTTVHQYMNVIDPSWTIIGHATGSTVASLGSAGPWTATTTGANLCYRYVNGTQTGQPLWPWPMNERIKQALAQAGSYSGPCINCAGGRLNRAGTADPTADVEGLLGDIPPACKGTPSGVVG